jgi:gamma-glutamylcyclotransferase (GGCT)/AIG2-like uncharacterized protein YtfP
VGTHQDKQLGFFVYGTLRPGYGNYERCLSDVRHTAVPARLAGARMFATGRPFPYASTKGARLQDFVVGALIEVAPEHYAGALRRLDWLEGHPRHYTRTATVVETEAGPVGAWAYLAGPVVEACLSEEQVVAGGDWAKVA